MILSKKIITKLFTIALLIAGYWLLATPTNAQIAQNDVALTWSANTYTPFDYPGKPLPVYGSAVTVDIIPLKSALSGLENYRYSWYLDGQWQEYASGENRQSFMFKVNAIANGFHSVELKLRNQDNVLLFSLFTIIRVTAPQIILIADDENSKHLSLITAEAKSLRPGQEADFQAIPYFYNISSPQELAFRWFFDGQSVIKFENYTKFSLRIGSGEAVSVTQKELLVQAENPRNPIQQAAGRIEIFIVPDKKDATYTTSFP